MARADNGRFSGDAVRWGGVIANVDNRQNETWIEIVARELNNSGRPREGDFSPGRFIAVLPGFVDPAVYAREREITVSGILEDAVEQMIGQHSYSYPKVVADNHVLWKPVSRNNGYNDGYRYPGYWPGYWPGYRYDPFLGPGYRSNLWYRPGPHRHYHHY